MSDIRIRPAVRSDEAALTELDRRTWAPDNAITPKPEKGSAFFDHWHLPDQFLVAERDGRLIGFVRLVQAVPVPSGAHVRQIQGLAVDPAERRRGLGRTLLDAALDEARRQGALRITLRVLSVNTKARRLYESMGFVVEGVLPGEFFLDGTFVDDILMGRRLDPA
ncbi:GNAT family N-acetyltransferase [Actinomadura scrupuli]|uniref:GNAT family N-acetyltransferase n=1 Tax=Actinomadura scrupuli TaxID=559629 RepID=UPI003D988623